MSKKNINPVREVERSLQPHNLSAYADSFPATLCRLSSRFLSTA